jgi:hypothetical protein
VLEVFGLAGIACRGGRERLIDARELNGAGARRVDRKERTFGLAEEVMIFLERSAVLAMVCPIAPLRRRARGRPVCLAEGLHTLLDAVREISDVEEESAARNLIPGVGERPAFIVLGKG